MTNIGWDVCIIRIESLYLMIDTNNLSSTDFSLEFRSVSIEKFFHK